MDQDYRIEVRNIVLGAPDFVRATAKGPVRGDQPVAWQKVVVRPVEIKGGRHLQFSYFTERQDVTKNYRGSEAEARLDELLAIPWASLYVETTGESFQVQLTKKRKAIIHRSQAAQPDRQPSLEHNARKDLPLPADRPDRFLHDLGIVNARGQVNASMSAKFRQINEFLKLLEHTGELEQLPQPVNILDAGCGSSYLSFAVYHYLTQVRGISARLDGVDLNQALIRKSNDLAVQLGYDELCFHTAPIAAYQPEVAPTILLALHACDTATDEALMQGIRGRAPLIMCAPCCHHHLHEQLRAREPFGPVFAQGILRQRLGDILTDTFRALILRIAGYKTDVVEFISPEHTDRNLLIRAVRRVPAHEPRFVTEYEQLKQFWNVTPFLETLLRREGLWHDRAADPDVQPQTVGPAED